LDILLGGKHPVLPANSYEHNKIERKIRLNGGGTIHYNGMDGAERIRSTSYGTICIDEASEFTAKEYSEVFDRLSDDVTWYPGLRQMYLATNPSGTSHFLYRRFFINKNSDREVIFSNSLNNFHLPKDYIRSSLESKTGVDYTKYVQGMWANNANCVYDNFDRNKHANIELDKTGYDSYYIGLDYGYKDPMAIMVIGKKGERLFVLEETYKTEMLMNEIIDRVKYYVNKYPDPVLIYDPSAAGLGGQIENIGLNIIKANNDISIGIARVRDLFQFHNGISNLNIDPKCINTINEIENYQYKEDSDKPIDINNHLVDSLRYLVNYIEDMKVEYSLPSIFTMDDNEDDKVEYDGFGYSSQ
jgi:phage terminase large subunit